MKRLIIVGSPRVEGRSGALADLLFESCIEECPEDEVFLAPHSRYAKFEGDFIREYTDLRIFAESDEAGVYLAVSPDARQVYVTGHPEYDADTLHNEFVRDTHAGINPRVPKNYYRNDDPSEAPHATWRSHGHLLFTNWLNYYVYQNTPYDLAQLGQAAGQA